MKWWFRKRINMTPPEKFAADFKDYPVAITTYDAVDPRMVACNKAHEKLTGYSMKDVIGKNPRIFRSDHQIEKRYIKITNALINDDFYTGIIQNKKPDGSIYDIRLSIFGVIIDGSKYFLSIKMPL